jgi:hypothetical protein
VFCYAAITSLAMFTPQRLANHARYTKVLLIKLPKAQEFIDDCFLLSYTAQFGDVTRFIKHSTKVEICAEAAKYDKHNIGEYVGRKGYLK